MILLQCRVLADASNARLSQHPGTAAQPPIVHAASQLPLLETKVQPLDALQIGHAVEPSHRKQPAVDYAEPDAAPPRIHCHYRVPGVCEGVVPEEVGEDENGLALVVGREG